MYKKTHIMDNHKIYTIGRNIRYVVYENYMNSNKKTYKKCEMDRNVEYIVSNKDNCEPYVESYNGISYIDTDKKDNIYTSNY